VDDASLALEHSDDGALAHCMPHSDPHTILGHVAKQSSRSSLMIGGFLVDGRASELSGFHGSAKDRFTCSAARDLTVRNYSRSSDNEVRI